MRKVLLIEDNKDVLENTAAILEFADYNVSTAKNGAIGIEKARQFLPDIILCDIMMPEVDGYTVLETLGQDSITASIPFVFLTAKSDIKDVRMGMSCGADDYLIKPFEEKELLDALDMRLRKSDFLKQKFSKNAMGINTFFKEASEYLGMELLSKNRELQEFQDREEIYQEGETANHLYFIQKGNVKVFKVTEGGKELVSGIYGEGDFVGQLSILNNCGTYLETASVIEYAEVLSIPKEDFTKLVYGNKVISNKFLDLISNDMVHLQEQLMDMAFASVKQRAAKVLLELSEKGMMEDAMHQGINIPREDFAGMIGTATETAIRALSEFKRQGLVGLGVKKKLVLLDENGLRQIADFG
ncbi:transcriptional regulator [Flagellimonas aquimarina]|uniref:Transcriptional regulator n=1 Tax=Flagellimonas aquimarina TaxID=2201895 RepID=A0A316L7X7_9FLAO|nr:response regulator [Allomuricauda koreensis]PWL40413.1 transcriptional regulator [Allomuricauda koreensis]